MTKQESFKRRVRARMAKTGERYVTARRALLAESDGRRRRWAAEPETTDEAVQAATGRTWDDWCDLLDQRPDRSTDHQAIARYVADVHGIDGWWAQTVTVGYERITGLRLPYQRPDGTFTAGRSATVVTDVAALRRMLLSDDDRRDLFPDHDSELRSRPTSKSIRIAVGPGIAQIAIEPKGDGRATVTVAHERLPSVDDVDVWKFYWSDWLQAIDGADAGGAADSQ